MSDIEQIIQDEIDDLIRKEVPLKKVYSSLRRQADQVDLERATIGKRKQQLQLALLRLTGSDRTDMADANRALAKRETQVRKEADQ